MIFCAVCACLIFKFFMWEIFMRKTVTLLATLLLILTVVILTVARADKTEASDYKVILSVGEGATVTSENPLRVENGGNAIFTVDIQKGVPSLGPEDPWSRKWQPPPELLPGTEETGGL